MYNVQGIKRVKITKTTVSGYTYTGHELKSRRTCIHSKAVDNKMNRANSSSNQPPKATGKATTKMMADAVITRVFILSTLQIYRSLCLNSSMHLTNSSLLKSGQATGVKINSEYASCHNKKFEILTSPLVRIIKSISSGTNKY